MYGQEYYLAPELELGGLAHGKKVDIWALGMLLFEMATLKLPGDSTSKRFTANDIANNEHHDIPKHYSDTIHNLLLTLLEPNKDKRPSCKQILQLAGVKEAVADLVNSQ